MTVSIFSGCTESCGWVAAVVSVLAFGTFGVPLKTSTPSGIEVHALVLQTYKTMVCFLTCWLILLAGEELRFSYWGIASGVFWVPGAACGIYGIRSAGLAVAVGTWSSITVLTSFVFGIIIFQESVKNIWHTSYAFMLLIVGLIGMAKYSSSSSASSASTPPPPPPPAAAGTLTTSKPVGRSPSGGSSKRVVAGLRRVSSFGKESGAETAATIVGDSSSSSSGSNHAAASANKIPLAKKKNKKIQPLEMEPLVMQEDGDDEMEIMYDYDDDKEKEHKASNRETFVFCGGRVSLTRRQTGMLGAVINGAWGGMNLIPLHYAVEYDNLSGAGYLISYATGSLIVNAIIWVLFFLWYYYQLGNLQEAADALPKLHLEHLWLPGLLAGVLYSLGNFGSILAVAYLGQGTGFSFCMMQLFVSGLWGVFYFREIRGVEIITKWFLSAAVAVTGIIWLSYEHEGESMGHRL